MRDVRVVTNVRRAAMDADGSFDEQCEPRTHFRALGCGCERGTRHSLRPHAFRGRCPCKASGESSRGKAELCHLFDKWSVHHGWRFSGTALAAAAITFASHAGTGAAVPRWSGVPLSHGEVA